ncbi:DUF922 domain-containing protein [Streptomyces sp. NPDC006670]|uniref:DUF922 domain-containing protein n=1 Tax=Streptomyces sp. NPDC006670 TaxID=3154476 RepID=UPI0033C83090
MVVVAVPKGQRPARAGATTLLAVALAVGPGTPARLAAAAAAASESTPVTIPLTTCNPKPGVLNPGDYNGTVAIDSLIPNGEGELHINSHVHLDLSVDDAGAISGSWSLRSANYRTDVDLQVDILMEGGKITGDAHRLLLSGGHGTYTTTQDGDPVRKVIDNGRVSGTLFGTDLGGAVQIGSIGCDEISGSHTGAQGPFTDSGPTPVTLKKAGCSQKPRIDDSHDTPMDVSASTVDEFLTKAQYSAAGTVAVGHMAPKIGFEFDFDDKGKVSKVDYSLETRISVPRWVPGHPPPTPDQKALIDKAIALITVHENKHRDIAHRAAEKAVCAAVGLTADPAKAAVLKADCDGFREQEVLDLGQGAITVVRDKDGNAVDVKVGPLKVRPNYSKFPHSGC